MSLDRTNLDKYIPKELKNKKQWVFHRIQKNAETGHFDKNMINPYNGRFASCTDNTHWADFNTAIKQAGKYDGEGITFVNRATYLGNKKGKIRYNVTDLFCSGSFYERLVGMVKKSTAKNTVFIPCMECRCRRAICLIY